MSFTAAECQAARRPLASLIQKSDKARQKLAPASWQARMLQDNLQALRLAEALMAAGPAARPAVPPDALPAALRAMAAMTARTEKALARFPPGTSPHTLQRNRLQALRVAAAFLRAARPR